MAATIIDGALTLTFGTPTVAGLIVQSASFTQTSNITEVIDEDGDYVAAAIHGLRINGEISAVDNGYAGTIGSTLAVTGAPSGTYYITEISQSRTADGFQERTVSLQSWPAIA